MNSPHFNPDDVADAAMRVFWRKGYAATSIQDLVEGTGLSRSSLYNTFESKHGLFQYSLRRYQGQTAVNIAILAQDGPAKERIRELLLNIVKDELTGEACCGCLVANTSLELGGRDSTVTNLLVEHFGALETALTALMQRGQQQGDITADTSPEALARFIVATIQGLRVLGRGMADKAQAQRLHDVVEVAIAALQS
jgi:TetR/AcrR family transcriptional repressor of nem operon